MLNLIIDLGAHDGADLPYYLGQAKRVIAVEPIPTLAADIRSCFSAEIEAGRLVLVERVIQIAESDAEDIAFLIDPLKPEWSHIATKEEEHAGGSSVVRIKSVLLEQLFREFGVPEYLKMDLEGYDKHIVNWLCDCQRYWPLELSFERVPTMILERLLATSPYKYFNIVSFYNQQKVFRNKTITQGAGPFGSDIRSPWMNRNDFRGAYKKMPYSWFDIHAVKELPTGSELGPPDMNLYRIPLLLRLKTWLWRARERLLSRPIG